MAIKLYDCDLALASFLNKGPKFYPALSLSKMYAMVKQINFYSFKSHANTAFNTVLCARSCSATVTSRFDAPL